MKTIDTLEQDVHELFNPANKHDVNEENLQIFVEHCVAALKEALESPEHQNKLLRLSATGKGLRKLWYEKETFEENPEVGEFRKSDGELQLRFLTGHIVEALLLFLAREAGHSVEHEQEEVEIEGVLGHIDAVIDGHLCDVKTASHFGFNKFNDESLLHGNDPYRYMAQISAYNTALATKGVELKEPSYFWAYNKSNSNMKVLPVHEYEDAREMITKQKAVLKDDVPIPQERCYPDEPVGKAGNMRLSKECNYCPFKHECVAQYKRDGAEIRDFQYSNEVVHMTKVVREPSVEEIK